MDYVLKYRKGGYCEMFNLVSLLGLFRNRLLYGRGLKNRNICMQRVIHLKFKKLDI